MSDDRPIGVMDSGVGGLTVVKELRAQLPSEDIIYLADIAHFPYGPRFQHEVREFALAIVDYLVSRDVKLVVIACNTATAAALEAAREKFDVPIIGVIAPGAQAAVEATKNGRVAVISTEGTYRSQQYLYAIKEADPAVGVLGKATPELVDLVEQGKADSAEAEQAMQAVLDEVLAWGADTLVLGCTHYPLLRPIIDRLAAGRINVVDSAASTAKRVARALDKNRLQKTDGAGALELLVTGLPAQFEKTAQLMFGDHAQVTVLDLWSTSVRSGS
jgi:glutamate racemase